MTTPPGPDVRPVVVLMGPPGAGKTTVGRELAEALDVDFVDTDHRIEERAGISITDIFLERGEAAFRELEEQVVAEELTRHAGVLALGGGAVLAPATQEALAGHTVVYLEVSVGEAAKRAGLDAPRPVLGMNPRSALVKLLNQRRPIYERLATVRVDSTSKPAFEVTRTVLAVLGLDGRS